MLTVLLRRSPRRLVILSFVATLALAPSFSSRPEGHTGQGPTTFTSAIDITSGRIHVRAVVPHRDTGAPTEVPLPVGLLGPKMLKVMNTPLGAQLDEYWNVTPNPATGKTPRQEACDGPKGIKAEVQKAIRKIGSGFSAYDISCNLATQGMVVAKQSGNVLYLSYQLLNNTVEFYSTTPGTCHRDRGTPFCPNDPHFSVRFASEVWTVVRTPGLCQFTSGDGTANLHAVQIDTHNFTGEIARNILDTLFLGNKFSAAELAIQATQQQVPLPLDDAMKELRESAPCADRNHPAAQIVDAFSEVESMIDPREGVVIRLKHPPLATPTFQNVDLAHGADTCKQGFVWREAFNGDTVCVTPQARAQAAADNGQAGARREPHGGAYGPNTCKPGYVWRVARADDLVCVTPQVRSETAADNAQASARRMLGGSSSTPSFARPTLAVQPMATAGSTVRVNGQLFPPTNDATVLRLLMDRQSNTACNGGATELEWGPAGGQMRGDRLPRSGNISTCAYTYDVKGLTPSSAYQFRARDCNALTCSRWTAPLRLTTSAAGGGGVVLTLDAPGGAPLGTATVNAKGAFEVDVTIPGGTTAGMHAIHAVSGDATAQTGLQITAASAGAAGTIMLTGAIFGDTGCPRRTLPDYAQKVTIDTPFSLFGAGFGPGSMTLHVDAPSGPSLGAAAIGADGTFCKADFQGPPAALLGKHSLVAVQNGAAIATIPVEFIRPMIVRSRVVLRELANPRTS